MAVNNTTVSLEFTNKSIYLSLLAIPIFAVILNVLLLVAFIKDPLKCFRNSATYLVMNLAVSDSLPCLLYSFLHVHKKTYSIYVFLVSWLWIVSILSITFISIDRFLIVAYPMKYRILIKGKIILWLAAIWTVSGIVAAWTNLFTGNSTMLGQMAFSILSMSGILLSSVMYSSTYYKLKKQSRNIALQNSIESRAQEIRILKEKRFLKTIVIIACIAFVCVVPSMVFFLIMKIIALELGPMASLLSFILPTYLLQINSAVNPLIYFLRFPNYRKTFYTIYCRRRTAFS